MIFALNVLQVGELDFYLSCAVSLDGRLLL